MNRCSWLSIMCLIKPILFISYLENNTCDFAHILSQNAVFFMIWGQAHLFRPFADKNVHCFQNSKKKSKILKIFQHFQKNSEFWFFFSILKFLKILSFIFFKYWKFWIKNNKMCFNKHIMKSELNLFIKCSKYSGKNIKSL